LSEPRRFSQPVESKIGGATMHKNRDLMIGEIHCWLTDDDDTNYAQGSLSMILGLVSDYEQD